jgi:hypothetical protein
MALRGFTRPIAEIQYLDYLLYAIQILSDDLATLRYRTVGKQSTINYSNTWSSFRDLAFRISYGNDHKRNSKFMSST